MFIPYDFSYDSPVSGQTSYELDGLINLDEVKATRHTKDSDTGESWEIVFGETQTVEVDKATFDIVQQQLLATNQHPNSTGK